MTTSYKLLSIFTGLFKSVLSIFDINLREYYLIKFEIDQHHEIFKSVFEFKPTRPVPQPISDLFFWYLDKVVTASQGHIIPL